ncbi:unnamed protein product [Symbiodinium natans]|uniref:Reverse transcriptase domain-containing protein n=1 Tax=Symbiodinium natans TaxID=878477 RepID=A0A812KI20_9DINO|nr:unnamed protein product [Symbiodinium natans]
MTVDVLASADADLRFQMEEAGVSADVQKAIYAEGFTSVRVFAGLEETREGVRAALKSSFKLDSNESPAMRKEIALLLAVWEGARSLLTYQAKNKEEAKQGTQNRLMQSSEYGAMRTRVEQVLSRTLKDREAPSKALVASKLEQLEDGVPKAEDLRDVTSYEDVEGEAYSAIIDPATAMLRIKPGRASTIPPGSPEELRLRHRRIGLAWDFVKTRHSTRAWVPDNCVDCFRVLSDHVLGSAVAGLRSASGQGPTWSLVLSYEQELRKAAYRYIRDGQCKDLRAALEKACDAPEVLTTHFIVPFTLGKAEDPVDMPDLTKVPWLHHGKGGKGKGGGKAPDWGRQWGKSNKTPDGRALCFKFNKESGGSVAQRAVADPGKRKSVATADEAASGDEEELWNNIFPSRAYSGLEYEEGGDGIRIAGLRGTGPPLYCRMGGARKPFTDGCGLCSPGRWPPSARQDAYENVKLSFHQRLATKLHNFVGAKLNVRDLAFKLAAGVVKEAPFSDEMLEEGRSIIWKELRDAGCQLPVEEKSPGQPFYLAAIEELLRLAGDPDSAAFYTSQDSFAKGVRLGVGVELPRVPAVFTAKDRWRTYPDGPDGTVLRDNYVSAKEHAAEVQKQFEIEAELGAMYETDLEAACRELGEVSVASLGAIEKKDGSYRVTHDATHGLSVNSVIKVRDQMRCPGAGDLRRALQTLPTAFFALSGDVARAHRLVKIAKRDWKHLCCRTGTKRDDVIWVNCVGTFGVSSAAYHWCRLMSGLGRSAFFLFGKFGWMQLVYVDDLLWLVGDKGGIEKLITVIFYYSALGLPFAWKKFSGGLVCKWVGFELTLAERALGLTEGRAKWIISWVSHTVDAGAVRMADFRAVLGRLSFAFTVLPNFRPLLGPLYAWSAAMGSFHSLPLPKLVVVLLNFLKASLERLGRNAAVADHCDAERELFRTDARAEGDEVWIGGFALDNGTLSECRWFAERISHNTGKWLFLAGESYRAIASLELLATLTAVVLFGVPGGQHLGCACSASTDNRGNAFAVSKLMTTKFPLCAFLLELAMQLQMKSSELQLRWLPRLQNVEADRLTNGDFTGFSDHKRLRFSVDEFRGILLSDMLDLGSDLYGSIREAKTKGKLRIPKTRREDTLKCRDPWM